jgi:hypothetical protein
MMRGLASALRRYRRGGMPPGLDDGIPLASWCQTATLHQRKRGVQLALGRCLREKVAGRDNRAGGWLDIAAALARPGLPPFRAMLDTPLQKPVKSAPGKYAQSF